MEEKLTWLEFQSQRTGKSVEDIRKEMSERSKLANRSNSGLASLTPERRREIARKGYQAGLGKRTPEQVSADAKNARAAQNK